MLWDSLSSLIEPSPASTNLPTFSSRRFIPLVGRVMSVFRVGRKQVSSVFVCVACMASVLPSFIQAQQVESGAHASQQSAPVKKEAHEQSQGDGDGGSESYDALLSKQTDQQSHASPKLAHFYKPWLFARVSEANTLFIEPHFKGKIPFAHLIKTDHSLSWCEFDGEKNFLWEITKVDEQDSQLTLELGDAGEVVVFPYPDIEHCLLIIRKAPNAKENPTRFAVPYQHLGAVPFLKGD